VRPAPPDQRRPFYTMSAVPRFEAVLLDYGNTVVQFDRPQIEWIHIQLAEFLSRTVAPIGSLTLGKVMDRVCVLPPLSEDKREFTAIEQMKQVLQEAYDMPFRDADHVVVEANREYQDLFVRSVEIDDETLRALDWARQRVRLGLISNYPCGPSLRRSLSAVGIAELFDPIVVSGEVGYVKPHPKLFQVALEALGIPAEAVLFVGDNWANDMVGAHTVGMATCHHLGLTSEKDYEERYRAYRPDFSIHHLAELDHILDPE
jgi:HAD superfamily hydrolase (TIGR01549 family)